MEIKVSFKYQTIELKFEIENFNLILNFEINGKEFYGCMWMYQRKQLS